MDKTTIVALDDLKLISDADDADPAIIFAMAELFQSVMNENREVIDKAVSDAMIFGQSSYVIGKPK